MDPQRVHETYERFVAEFLLPAWQGGRARAGRPVAPATLDYFATARPLDPEREGVLGDAFRRECGRVAPVDERAWPDEGTWALAMAAHDLLAVTDPAMGRAWARRARPVVLRWVDALIARAGPPETREGVLGRHAVVGAVLRMRRRDVEVRHWAGLHRFDGRPVPARVRALRRLRRVRETARVRGVREVCDAAEGAEGLTLVDRLDMLAARSPLTPVLALEPGAFGAAALDALGDLAIRQGVAFHLAARGMDAVAAPLEQALAWLDQTGAPPEARRRAAALVDDVRQLAVPDDRGSRAPDASPAPAPEAVA